MGTQAKLQKSSMAYIESEGGEKGTSTDPATPRRKDLRERRRERGKSSVRQSFGGGFGFGGGGGFGGGSTAERVKGKRAAGEVDAEKG